MSRSSMRRAPRATALWACLMLLEARCYCQSHAAAAAAAAAAVAAAGAWRSSSSLGALRLEASQRSRARQLSAFTAHQVGRPAPALLPYPRAASAVQRYLADALAEGPQLIPVWFVVVTDPGNARATNMTQPQAAAQVDLLNRAFATGLQSGGSSSDGAVVTEAGSPAARRAGGARDWRLAQALWQFQLAGVRHVTSSSAMCVGSNAEQALKAYWRPRLAAEGGAPSDRTLVVYVSNIAAGCKGASPAGYAALFGFSNSPQDLVFWKHNSMAHRDGVVVDFKYLLDAGSSNFNGGSGALHGAASGAQLVHETGHWMGLVHTFEGGCSASAAATDQVDDTPAEAHPLQWGGVDMRDASGGCRPRDSCGGQPGADLYDNWMDYNNLGCARSFTPGQQARMLYMFRAVRRE